MNDFNPLKPTKHINPDDILYQNNLMTDHATQLVNKTHKAIIEINRKFYTVSETEQKKLQTELDKLHIKLIDYDDHLQFCLLSLQNAIDLKISMLET